jgi:hypothetical protein
MSIAFEYEDPTSQVVRRTTLPLLTRQRQDVEEAAICFHFPHNIIFAATGPKYNDVDINTLTDHESLLRVSRSASDRDLALHRCFLATRAECRLSQHHLLDTTLSM